MILMVKATSLVSTITIMDVTGIARLIIAKTFSPVEIFIVAGLIYLTINFIVTRLVNLCEIKLTPYLRRVN
jgi:octopine/nopaline transport system permease protein